MHKSHPPQHSLAGAAPTAHSRHSDLAAGRARPPAAHWIPSPCQGVPHRLLGSWRFIAAGLELFLKSAGEMADGLLVYLFEQRQATHRMGLGVAVASW